MNYHTRTQGAELSKAVRKHERKENDMSEITAALVPTDNGGNGVDTRQPAQIAALSGDPAQVVEKATAMATTLAGVIRKAGLAVSISGREYVKCEGWTTLLAMMGVFPRTEWTHRLDRPDEIAYEARVSLTHMQSGREITAAEAMASNLERKPWGRDEYAIRSMAQTRAVGKAAREAFSWIVTLAGFAPTPAEEMPFDGGVESYTGPGAPPSDWRGPDRDDRPPPDHPTVDHAREALGARPVPQDTASKADMSDADLVACVVKACPGVKFFTDVAAKFAEYGKLTDKQRASFEQALRDLSIVTRAVELDSSDFVESVAGKFAQYGRLTDKQRAALLKTIKEREGEGNHPQEPGSDDEIPF